MRQEILNKISLAGAIALLFFAHSHVLAEELAETRDLNAKVAILVDDSQESQHERVRKELEGRETEAIVAMGNLVEEKPEREYDYIPMIWRLAITTGERGKQEELAHLFDKTAPKADAAMKDWQCVVIGGGIICGASNKNRWPAEVLNELTTKDEARKQRWQHVQAEAIRLVNDESVKPGTRYDALRIIPLDDWKVAGPILEKYLASKNDEIQQGAVSGLGDINSDAATDLLLKHLPQLAESNQDVAIAALTRTAERRSKLKARLPQFPAAIQAKCVDALKSSD